MDFRDFIYQLLHEINQGKSDMVRRSRSHEDGLDYFKTQIQEHLPLATEDDPTNTWNAGFFPGPYSTKGDSPEERAWRALTAGGGESLKDAIRSRK